MRIGIALFQFFPGRIGGTGEYIERLIPGLLNAMAADDQLILFGNSDNLGPFSGLTDTRLQRLVMPWSKRWIQFLRLADLVLPGSLSQRFSPPLNGLQLDVLLCPQQSIFPRGVKAPTVVSVMDLLHYRCPELVSWWQKWLRRRKEQHFIRECQHTISISHATQADLREFYSIAAEKCSVVYLGGRAGHEAAGINPLPPGAEYTYYPANTYPHKNHRLLIRSFVEFRKLHPQYPCRLVMSGQCSPQIRNLIQSLDPSSGVIHLGYLSRAEVSAVYRDCAAVIIPSLFEGFGIPLIEGLGHGRPVICSDLAVFRELAGDAVDYCDATSAAGIQAALRRIYQRQVHRPEPQAVKLILDRLNWDRCAQETYAVLKSQVDQR